MIRLQQHQKPVTILQLYLFSSDSCTENRGTRPIIQLKILTFDNIHQSIFRLLLIRKSSRDSRRSAHSLSTAGCWHLARMRTEEGVEIYRRTFGDLAACMQLTFCGSLNGLINFNCLALLCHVSSSIPCIFNSVCWALKVVIKLRSFHILSFCDLICSYAFVNTESYSHNSSSGFLYLNLFAGALKISFS